MVQENSGTRCCWREYKPGYGVDRALISGVGYFGAPALQCLWPQEWSRIRLKGGLMWFSHKINICAPLKVSDYNT